MRSNHIRYIDVLKGIGILLVIFYGANVFSVEMTAMLKGIVPVIFLGFAGALYVYESKNKRINYLLGDNFRGLFIPYIWFSAISLVIEGIDVVRGGYRASFNRDVVYTITLKGMNELGFLMLLFLALSGYEIVRCRCNLVITSLIVVILTGMGGYVAYVFGRIGEPESLSKVGVLSLIYMIWRSGIGLLCILVGELAVTFMNKCKDKKVMLGIAGFVLVVGGMAIAYINRGYSLMELTFGKPYLYALSSVLVIIGFILFGNWIDRFEPLEFLGRNAKVMFVTFYTFNILSFANRLGDNVFDSVSNYFVRKCVILLTCVFFEAVCIIICNRVAFFMFGRKKPVVTWPKEKDDEIR